MFPAMLGTAAVASLLALAPATLGSYVIVATPDPAVEVGSVFPVDISVFAAEPINAVELELVIPSDKVDVFGVDRGRSVITIWTEDPVVTDSSVALRGGTFQRGFLGEHLIATVNLRAETAGQLAVQVKNVRFIAGDGAGTVVPVVNANQSRISVFQYDENTSAEEIAVITSVALKTDINSDGRVSLQDISVFVGAWTNNTGDVYDFSGDGQMTFTDFSILLSDLFFE